jgi:hypothetical protein
MYDKHYEARNFQKSNPRLISSPDLWSVDNGQLLAAYLVRLAQPLPNGLDSPFSSKAPGTAHEVIGSNLIHLLDAFGYESNKLSDQEIIQFFRFIGAETMPAENAVLLMRFGRSDRAIQDRIPVEIPVGTEVRSRYNPNLAVYTLYSATIGDVRDPDAPHIEIPARLNQLGPLPAIRDDEFTETQIALSFLARATNIDVVSTGRFAETLSETVLRTRDGIRTGTLGRFYQDGVVDFEREDFLGRCVNRSDYAWYAKEMGATKTNVLPGVAYGSDGYWGNLVSIAVYPPDIKPLIEVPYSSITLVDTEFGIIAAEIVPVTGTIWIKVTPSLTDFQVRDLAAIAIMNKINPPNGLWGDKDLPSNLADALEREVGIYAVPQMDLMVEGTDEPVSTFAIKPWHLWEVQASIEFKIIRTT